MQGCGCVSRGLDWESEARLERKLVLDPLGSWKSVEEGDMHLRIGPEKQSFEVCGLKRL